MKNWLASWFRLSRRNYVISLLVLAFVLRFAAVLALRNIHEFHGISQAGSDAVEFNALGLNMAAGHGYVSNAGQPTAFRAPGFPFLLAALYSISSENYPLVYVVLCLLGAITCLFTYLLAREVLPEGLGRLAGLFCAVYFSHIWFSTVFLSESLFALCVGLGTWCLVKYLRNSSVWFAACAGLCYGYASLTRPVALLLVPFVIVLPFWRPGTKIMCFRGSGSLFIAAFLVMAPWTVRNYLTFHQFVLVATNGGSTFYGANNDRSLHERAYLGGWLSTLDLPGRDMIEAAPDEVSREKVAWRLGISWVRTHLADMPQLAGYKLIRFWLPDVSSPNRKFVILQTVCGIPFTLLVLLGLVFSFRAPYRNAVEWWPLDAVVVSNLLNVIIFYGSPRFRDAITPVLMVYAALGLHAILSKFSRPPEG